LVKTVYKFSEIAFFLRFIKTVFSIKVIKSTMTSIQDSRIPEFEVNPGAVSGII